MKGALAWPFLRLYILALFFFSANAILNVMIPLRGHDLGATNATIGIVMGAYMLTAMLFRPWAGQVIAKVGPIKILRWILIINGFALILYGFTGLEGYFIARVMQGVCTAFFSMSLQIGIIDALPEEDRSQGISLYSLFSYIPGIIGPMIAVGIWQLDNLSYFALTMIIIAITTGVVGFSATLHGHDDADTTPAQQEKMPYGAMTVFLQLFKNPFLLKAGMIMLVASIGFGAVATFIVLYVNKYQVGHASLFLAVQAITVVFARFFLRQYIPSDGRWHVRFMLGVLGLLTVALLFIAIGPYVGGWILYISAVMIGLTQAMVYPTLTSFLSFKLPKVGRNMLLGLFIATADLGVSLGAALMGPIADMVGYANMYLICGILMAFITLMSIERRPQFIEK
ncbi:TPA: MFS transporter [Staphylococcus pseudintermedius]|uniref:staphylopine family metallophore export MFS transporter CntE n=1 Tax=Staphylococcus pseudintermedius TaxID=283734 RepID=UPI0003715AFF|nr:MFS transporter [Staphylococcus pseudintermedius]ANS90792.1 Antibiotic resistance protein [Staphylococcus pseudintermedius]EGQ0369887.1 MFS transporter [Staphylococcus pseudintermedius]EGQ0381845.1 MFS transporter [Staphylococcus pseudintermedius]EGQ1288169.1 MFS transporter [Staphylococcus pseudintermedius]EGQ1292598.1 MFS transporter [Staphylococcus pseudintermedius]